MRDGENGSKELSATVGGCAMNTGRSANFYLQAKFGMDFPSRIMTLGSIGIDEQGIQIEQQLGAENLGFSVFKCEQSTG